MGHPFVLAVHFYGRIATKMAAGALFLAVKFEKRRMLEFSAIRDPKTP
jgi:hypothetical protein